MVDSDGHDPNSGDTPPPDFSSDGTRVDLGEDLLEKTAVIPLPGEHRASPPSSSSPSRAQEPEAPRMLDFEVAASIEPSQVADHLQSARILMGEGMWEDAKRLLRRIILADPGRVEARKMLEELLEMELKQIISDTSTPRGRLGKRDLRVSAESSADAVLSALERDLGLGDVPSSSLFRDRAALDAFGDKMDREFSGGDPSERVDLGVAFHEMGLYGLAERHFRAAIQSLQQSDPGAEVPVISLLAYSLILDGRPFDATIELQQALGRTEVEAERKLDLMYLMGRAVEALGQAADARAWYLQAASIEPRYRDLEERLRRLPSA